MNNNTKNLKNLGALGISRKVLFCLGLATSCGVLAINAAPGLSAGVEGAKDLFYRQVSNQAQTLNTGLQYWIELKRAGKVTRVSNKFAFQSGDSIRFHVTSNTDAYAYIVLREGSHGEQSVLFPDPNYHDNNKLKSTVDYSLPQDGALTFDRNPGTENLILLLSRTPIDANKYLADKTKKHVMIASVKDGSKDLIPGSVVLAYSNQDGSLPNAPVNSNSTLANATGGASAAPTQNANGSNSNGNASNSNGNGTHTVGSANSSANSTGSNAANSTGSNSANSTGSNAANSTGSNAANSTLASTAASANDAVTTLVQKDPTQILAVDLALMHQP